MGAAGLSFFLSPSVSFVKREGSSPITFLVFFPTDNEKVCRVLVCSQKHRGKLAFLGLYVVTTKQVNILMKVTSGNLGDNSFMLHTGRNAH